jgi:hypothetical protein
MPAMSQEQNPYEAPRQRTSRTVKTQFTLRQLFYCVTCFAAAFAILSITIPIWLMPNAPELKPPMAILCCVGPSTACTLLGAGIGQLVGHPKGGAILGGCMTMVLLFAYALWTL